VYHHTYNNVTIQ